MAQAVQALDPTPQLVLVDGNQPLPLTFPQQPVIKGDALCPSISAASIVAKVYRDTLMERLHQRYPQYNFARHKGYATAEHLEALRCWGPCELHRRTFRGVKEWLEESNMGTLEKGEVLGATSAPSVAIDAFPGTQVTSPAEASQEGICSMPRDPAKSGTMRLPGHVKMVEGIGRNRQITSGHANHVHDYRA